MRCPAHATHVFCPNAAKHVDKQGFRSFRLVASRELQTCQLVNKALLTPDLISIPLICTLYNINVSNVKVHSCA
jgi:hypothetical protein